VFEVGRDTGQQNYDLFVRVFQSLEANVGLVPRVYNDHFLPSPRYEGTHESSSLFNY
jgi:hypothetical protein